jgi:predicted RNA-binding Zn-ribbon protein involved in translation (DUF1610 family)
VTRSSGGQGPRLGVRRAPGVPCPECGTPLVISADGILSGQPVACPGCGLELRVDGGRSAGGLRALRTYMEEVERIRESLAPQEPPRPGPKPGRRPIRKPGGRRR